MRRLFVILLLLSQHVWAQHQCRILSNVPDWGHVVGVLYSDSLAKDSLGTAFVISRPDLVMACAHEVGQRKILYFLPMKGNVIFRLFLKEMDTAADLALLQAKTNISAYPPLQFANSLDLSRGDSICYICYNPLTNYCCLHYTTLLSINRELNSTGLKRCMQYFGETVPGNSGGPVLNTFGEVIGIIKGRIIINDVISNRGCAFPILTFENCLRDDVLTLNAER